MCKELSRKWSYIVQIFEVNRVYHLAVVILVVCRILRPDKCILVIIEILLYKLVHIFLENRETITRA